MIRIKIPSFIAGRALASGFLLAALAAAVLLAAKPIHASTTFTVNSTGDAGDQSPGNGSCTTGGFIAGVGVECTLRAAIQEANATAGADTISFNIPGSGVKTISPTTPLPTITQTVTIDGYTQPGAKANTKGVGNDAVILVELNGEGAGPAANGLTILNASSNVIRGLAINRFAGRGIEIKTTNAGLNKIEGNSIGADPFGTEDLGNGGAGVFVESANNTVGGTSPAARNVISGNGVAGVEILGKQFNKVLGNYIGTKRDGNGLLGNSGSGVLVADAATSTIGGTTSATRNLISGNGENGIFLDGPDATGNLVQGNLVGTNASGTVAIPNGLTGIKIEDASFNTIGGTEFGARNVVSGNLDEGISIGGTRAANNVIQGNFIGTNVSGTGSLGNARNGVEIFAAPNSTIGGASSDAANTIAFNGRNGVEVLDLLSSVVATGNRVMRNSIFSNSELGINLGGIGRTLNDPGDTDTGANNLQNFPVLTSAINSDGTTTIRGTLDSNPDETFVVRLFSNPPGTDEGKTFLGQTGVTTDASGGASFEFSPASPVAVGEAITATATSEGGDTSEFSFPVPVNTPPAANDDSYSVNEDGTLSVPDGPTDVLANDTDAENDSLTVAQPRPVSKPSNGTLLGLSFNGSFTYFPKANFSGSDSFTYKASDSKNAESNLAKVNITVNPVNDAPSFSKGPDQTTSEDSGAQTVPGWATGISRGPADESAQSVSFLVSNDNNALFSSQPAVAPDGTLTFTPAPDQSGTATVSVKIKDDGGTANGGVDESAPQSFTISVSAVDDAPVASDDSYSVDEDTTLTVPDGSADLLANDSDAEGGSLEALRVSGPSKGTLTLNEDGSFTYEPNANFSGTDSFTYQTSDGQLSGNTALVQITVRPVNDAPTITPLTPKPGSQTKDSTPTVRARVSDLETNLAKINLKLFVDGKERTTFSYDRATDILSFQSPTLSIGQHTVKVVATDAGGLSTTRQWNFQVVR